MHDVVLVEHAGRGDEGAGDRAEEVEAEVHLEEVVALIDALFEIGGELGGVGRAGGVGVAEDFVAEAAAGELVGGDAIGFAGEVDEGHFDGADAAGLPGVVAELFDFAEEAVDVAGVSPRSRLLSMRA